MVEIKRNMNITTVLFCIFALHQLPTYRPTPPPPKKKKNTVRPFSADVARIAIQIRKTDFEEVYFITLNPGQTVSQVNES